MFHHSQPILIPSELLEGEVFRCSICSKVFGERRRYTQHCKTHAKPYKCEQCQRGFALRNDLSRHVKTRHRVAQPTYYCVQEGCDYFSYRKDNFNEHLRKRHRHSSNGSARNADLDSRPTSTDSTLNDPCLGPSVRADEQSRHVAPASVFHAATIGSIGLLQHLHDLGVDMFATEADGSNILHVAASMGNAETIQYLLNLGVPHLASNNKGQTPILLAAKSGSWPALRALLCFETTKEEMQLSDAHIQVCLVYLAESQSDALVEAYKLFEIQRQTIKDDTHFFVSYQIVKTGNVSALRSLIAYRAISTTSINFFRESLLHCAAYFGRAEMMQLLLTIPGFDVNLRDDLTKATPLCVAVRRGNKDVVRVLLQHDGVNFQEHRSRAKEITLAVRYFHFDIARLLIMDSRIETVASELHSTAGLDLLRSVVSSDEDVVSSILRRADFTLPSLFYAEALSPLFHAVVLGNTSIAKQLLEFHVLETKSPCLQIPVLEIAARKSDQQMLQLLLAYQERIDYGTLMVTDAFQVIVHQNNIQLLEIMLRFTDLDPNQGHPLIRAINSDNVEIARLLLSHTETDPQEQEGHISDLGNAPTLVYATAKRKIDLVELLLSHKTINIEKRCRYWSSATKSWNQDGKTALAVARQNDDAEMIALLLTHGAKDDTAEGPNQESVTASGDIIVPPNESILESPSKWLVSKSSGPQSEQESHETDKCAQSIPFERPALEENNISNASELAMEDQDAPWADSDQMKETESKASQSLSWY